MRYLLFGANSGIGLNLSERLVGHELEVVARTSKELPSSLSFTSFDVCDFSKELPQFDGEFDGIVYFPGTISLKPFNQIRLDEFRKDWEINCLGAIRVVQHYLSQVRKQSSSSIIFLSTVAVDQGMNYHTSIASAKGALESFARALAAELAPYIRVNVVAPSLTETPLTSKLLSSDSLKEKAAKRHPSGRFGTPKDIASVIHFLLSEESSWITGQVLHVDGGLSSLRLL